jgi:hypothetical protein
MNRPSKLIRPWIKSVINLSRPRLHLTVVYYGDRLGIIVRGNRSALERRSISRCREMYGYDMYVQSIQECWAYPEICLRFLRPSRGPTTNTTVGCGSAGGTRKTQLA